MKSINDLMKELGWNEKANKSVAKAFIKNLTKAAKENSKPQPLKPVLSKGLAFKRKKDLNQQLSFDLDPDKPLLDLKKTS